MKFLDVQGSNYTSRCFIFMIRGNPLRKGCFTKITIFDKVWWQVFRVQELVSPCEFLKFLVRRISLGKGYFTKITIFYKVSSKIFRVKESVCPSEPLKFPSLRTSELPSSEFRILTRKNGFLDPENLWSNCGNYNHFRETAFP